MTNVQKVSLLTLIHELPGKYPGNKKKGLYRCECGNLKEIFIGNVTRLHTLSCGCFKQENPGALKHGLRKHPLYRIWSYIKTRCYNSKFEDYSDYGGAGVRMCDKWLEHPELFVKWALDNGWEKGMNIDKDIKAKKANIPAILYSDEFCSVVTSSENQNAKRNNRPIEYNGVTKNVMQWAEWSGVSKAAFWYRIKKCNFDMYAYVKKWNK